MPILDTKTDHNIPDLDFKLAVSETADRIKYAGREYLKKLESLNKEYIIDRKRILTEREFSESQVY